MADVFDIAGRINSTSNEHVVTTADQIKDEDKNKKQSQINAETISELATHESRLNAYTEGKFVTVDTYSGLPATGVVDTVYRVSSWDGTANSGQGAVDVTKYSEYAWENGAYKFLDVKTQIGEVFDISEYNNDTYTDLADALSGTNVPQDVRRGGMSIKYVCSSDNKYVCYMLTAQSWSTNESDWEKTNFADELADLNGEIGYDVYDNITNITSSTLNVEIPCKIKAGTTLAINAVSSGTFTWYIRLHKEDDTYDSITCNQSTDYSCIEDIQLAYNIKKIQFISYQAVSGNTLTAKVSVKGMRDDIAELNNSVSEINTELNTLIIDNGETVYDDTIQVTSSDVSVNIPCNIPVGKTLRANVKVVGGTYSPYIRFYKEDNTYIEKVATSGKLEEDITFNAKIVKINIISYIAVSGTSIDAFFRILGRDDDIADMRDEVDTNSTEISSLNNSVTALLADSLNISKTVSVTDGNDVNLKFVGTFKAGQKINIKLSNNAFHNINLTSIDSSNEIVETFVSIINHLDFDITLSQDAYALRFMGIAITTSDITVTLRKYTENEYVRKEYSSSVYRPELNIKDKYLYTDGTLKDAYVQGSYEVTDYIDIRGINNLYAVGCRVEVGAVTYCVYDNGKNFVRYGIINRYTYLTGERYVRYCMKTNEAKKNISIGTSAAPHIEAYTEHYYLFERMFNLYAKPCVSLIADDFVYGDYDYAGYGRTATEQQNAFKSALLNAGLTCDVAASYDLLHTEDKRAIAIDWEKQGFQFIFHPIHAHWFPGDGGLDLDAARAQLVDDIVHTRCTFPSRHRVFVYPGDSDRYGATEIIKEYFDCGITWENGANWQRPYSDGPNRFKIKRFNLQIGVKGTQTMAQMKASIDEAVAEKGWIIFGMHPHWLDLDGVEPTNPEKFTIANMMEIINYALTATGTSKLVHVEEEWERRKPLYDFLGI